VRSACCGWRVTFPGSIPTSGNRRGEDHPRRARLGRPASAAAGSARRWHLHQALVALLANLTCDKIARLQILEGAVPGLNHASMRSGRVRGRVGGDAYLLEQVHERLDFPATLAAVRNMRCRWPGAEAKLIEDKANGSGWRQRLRREKILPRYTCTVHCLLVPTQTRRSRGPANSIALRLLLRRTSR
jgi:hypothetical protein